MADPTASRSSSTVTVLAYHTVDDGPGPLCLAPDVFARQLDELDEAGVTTLTFAEVAEHLRTGRRFPHRAVCLTFDDGYVGVHRHALPRLAAAGRSATVFPVTAHLGDRNRWDHGAADEDAFVIMERTQLRELADAGWELGGHTHTHRRLTRLVPEDIEQELTTADEIVGEISGRSVRTFAYPYGAHDRLSRSIAGQRYEACAATGAARAGLGSALDRVERVEAWYLRRAGLARLLTTASGGVYLTGRRTLRGARAVAAAAAGRDM